MESIGKDAFHNCRLLSSVTLPNTVKSIGSGAFSGCSNLKAIDGLSATGITKLEDYVFEDCASLGTIELPLTLTGFGKRVFDGCSSLKSLTIPSPTHVSFSEPGYNSFQNTLFDVDEDNGAWIYVPKNLLKGYRDAAGRKNYRLHLHAIGTPMTHLDECTITVNTGKGLIYTGQPIEPTVIVKDPSGEQLKNGQDYKTVYSNNTNAGTATVKVVPCEYDDDYTCYGSISKTFVITPAPISRCKYHYQEGVTHVQAYAYTGKARIPIYAIVDQGQQLHHDPPTLLKGIDYEVKYSNNTDVGTSSIVATGKGNYEGVIEGSFAIDASCESMLLRIKKI